jgi:hypothetical protein
MFLSLDMGETLGFAFGAGVVTVSLWLLYQWAIKPEREARRQNARRAVEEMHRNHWERLRSRPLHSRKPYEALTTSAETTLKQAKAVD